MNRAVILVEADRFSEVALAVASEVKSAGAMWASPMFVAAVDDPGLEKVRRLEGVVAVTIVGDEQIGVIDGIDWVMSVCIGQRNEWRVGGIGAGATYPAVYGEPVGVSAPPAIPAAVNLSLTPPNDDLAPTLPGDVVTHATRALSALSVPVLAAGNHHQLGVPYETMSPWAEPPWVLAVGATEDEAGLVEWPQSARGSSANPNIGPDILVWGQDRRSASSTLGTSFAAARASLMIVLCRAWLSQVVANVDRLGNRDFGVPLFGCAVIDRNFSHEEPLLDLAALPVLATAPEGLVAASNTVARLTLKVESLAAQAARVLLEEAARATSQNSDAHLSAPSISLQRLMDFLDGITGPMLLRYLGASDIDPGAAAKEVPLFNAGSAEALWKLVESSMPIWQWDVDKQTAGLRQQEEVAP